MFCVVRFICVMSLLSLISCDSSLVVDVASPPVGPLHHFWDSTGLCPPEPRSEAHTFLLSTDELMNLALISALPRRGISQVRIHWLLDLVTVRSVSKDGAPEFNFTYLDQLLDTLHDYGLQPGFELMGNPSHFFDDFHNETQVRSWQQLVRQTAARYIDRFGGDHVSRWRFETWNEPDLRSYNMFNFTLPSYVSYVRACVEGLNDVPPKTMSPRLRLGGPAGLFKSRDKHPLCWGLLEHCARHPPGCPLDFISYHKKGGGTPSAVLREGLQLVQDINTRFPRLANISFANDEADPLTGWSRSVAWRADVTYGAVVGRVVVDHQREFVNRRRLRLEVLSNDNAFMNYHPYYFTQRTLLARFQMNNTNPPHLQFFRKPVYTTMALLAFLGTREIHVETNSADLRLSYLAATTGQVSDSDWDAAVFLTYTNETQADALIASDVTVNINNLPQTEACCRFTVYRLDNVKTNPSVEWRRSGASVYPRRDARRRMRAAEGPERVLHIQHVADTSGVLSVAVRLRLPSVAVVHVCSRPDKSPGEITHLRAFNVTLNEVLLLWRDDRVETRCIKTYEIQFQAARGNGIETPTFRRVNVNDVIFLSYQHVVSKKKYKPTPHSDGAAGLYRVRAVDYWDRPGPFSTTITYPSVN